MADTAALKAAAARRTGSSPVPDTSLPATLVDIADLDEAEAVVKSSNPVLSRLDEDAARRQPPYGQQPGYGQVTTTGYGQYGQPPVVSPNEAGRDRKSVV